MKKYLKTGFVLPAFVMLCFLTGCEKEYYDKHDVKYSVTLPDTVYLDSDVVIRGTIEQPLDIRVYLGDLSEDNKIGVLKHYSDSIIWKPVNMEEGRRILFAVVNFKTGKSTEEAILNSKEFYIKKKPGMQ